MKKLYFQGDKPATLLDPLRGRVDTQFKDRVLWVEPGSPLDTRLRQLGYEEIPRDDPRYTVILNAGGYSRQTAFKHGFNADAQ